MAGSADIREREKIAKEIEKTSESIRKKHRALKTGRIDSDIEAKKRLGPIIEPLQKFVDNSTPSARAIKDERRVDDDDVGLETSSLLPTHKREVKDAIRRKITKNKRRADTSSEQQLHEEEEEEEGDAFPRKKKRTNVSSDRSLFKSIRNDDDYTQPPITSTPRATSVVQPIEDVFETTDDSFATSVQQHVQTYEGREALREHLGPLSREYIEGFLRGDARSGIDQVYGVYLDERGTMLGNKRFDVGVNDDVIVGGVRYIGTPGLYQLIFKKFPDDAVYTHDDLQKYKSILLATSAHKRQHNEHGQVLSNKGYKYKHVIAPLLSTASDIPRSGRGLPRAMTLNDNAIDYVHLDDPNELVDRLRLLEASHQAGHNAHDNEMLSIVEELREAGIIIN